MVFPRPLVVDQPTYWKPGWTLGPEPLTTHSLPLRITQILLMLLKILLHRNTLHQILWSSRRSGMES